MCRSYYHKSLRGLVAHYLSPLHLFAPIYKLGIQRKGRVKIICFFVVTVYDRIYQKIF